MGLKFYHVGWCPECVAVKGRLDALKVVYDEVLVPDTRMFRKQVFEVSGQYYVPVIKDGDLVLSETRDILAYLDETYGVEGKRQVVSGQWRDKTTKPDQSEAAPGEGDEYPSCRL